jgi:hypothetical protein
MKELKIVLKDKTIKRLNSYLIVRHLANNNDLASDFLQVILDSINDGKKEITFGGNAFLR